MGGHADGRHEWSGASRGCRRTSMVPRHYVMSCIAHGPAAMQTARLHAVLVGSAYCQTTGLQHKNSVQTMSALLLPALGLARAPTHVTDCHAYTHRCVSARIERCSAAIPTMPACVMPSHSHGGRRCCCCAKGYMLTVQQIKSWPGIWQVGSAYIKMHNLSINLLHAVMAAAHAAHVSALQSECYVKGGLRPQAGTQTAPRMRRARTRAQQCSAVHHLMRCNLCRLAAVQRYTVRGCRYYNGAFGLGPCMHPQGWAGLGETRDPIRNKLRTAPKGRCLEGEGGEMAMARADNQTAGAAARAAAVQSK